jgi:hypothetical protein
MGAADAADICDAIAAGLDANSASRALAVAWTALVLRGDEIADQGRDHRRATGRARAREKVADAGWDRNNSSFSRSMLDASNGKRDVAPYATYYPTTAPSKINEFGVDREVEIGRGILGILASEAGAAQRETWTPRWSDNTEGLATAARNKKDAVRAQATFSANETLYIDEINRELDRLEGDLLRLFPGDRDTVDAFLAPTRPTPKRSRGDEAIER